MRGARNGQRRFRVVHLPWDSTNPYLSCLAGALQSEDVESVPGRGHRLFLINNWLFWRANLLHFHWPDALIVNHSLSLTLLKSISFIVQVVLARATGLKVVWTAHDLYSNDRHHTWIERPLMGMFVRLVGAVIAHGPEALAAVVKEYPMLKSNCVTVIPHGPLAVNPDRLPAREAARAALGLPDDAFIFLSFGQIRRYKGLDVLIEAFKTSFDGRKAHLIIAGAARDQEFAASLIAGCSGQGNITIRLGLVGEEEQLALFAACDAVVLPYREGLTSGVASLAADFHRPCVATRTPAALDAFGPDGAVYISRLSPEGVRVALREAMGRSLSADGFAAFPPPRVRAGWAEIAKRTAAVYRTLL